MAKGHIEGKRRLRRIICGFEQDTFDHIASKAELEGVSVSEVIRTYVEWGIESEVLSICKPFKIYKKTAPDKVMLFDQMVYEKNSNGDEEND